MNIKMDRNDKELVITLEGKLNTLTSQELDKQMDGKLNGVERLVFDFAELSYISSAGLRILMEAAQIMDDQGEMIIRHINEPVRDVFQITNLLDEFIIED
ncbi:STAS domain-containing protein [Pseudobutyrivibrio sp. MD2005]|uniref:STAS domain-containing protein n=1 Tax=Pseudobutyrivibrio sp. MD2005 TaxID=1410616 RepID=UPI0005605B9E|nr:STAS domain-containing protein [Pseudobutyrivibrio sp. MD2005]